MLHSLAERVPKIAAASTPMATKRELSISPAVPLLVVCWGTSVVPVVPKLVFCFRGSTP